MAEEKRLVILDKTGKLLQQYRSPAFEQVRDFLVSPNDQAMYLFDTTKLYRISPVLPEST